MKQKRVQKQKQKTLVGRKKIEEIGILTAVVFRMIRVEFTQNACCREGRRLPWYRRLIGLDLRKSVPRSCFLLLL